MNPETSADIVLNERVRRLIAAGRVDEAEQLLQSARSNALRVSDMEALENVLDLLVIVYTVQQPPDGSKADAVFVATNSTWRSSRFSGARVRRGFAIRAHFEGVVAKSKGQTRARRIRSSGRRLE